MPGHGCQKIKNPPRIFPGRCCKSRKLSCTKPFAGGSKGLILLRGAVHADPHGSAVVQSHQTHQTFGVDPLGVISGNDPERLDSGNGNKFHHILKGGKFNSKFPHNHYSKLYKWVFFVYNVGKRSFTRYNAYYSRFLGDFN